MRHEEQQKRNKVGGNGIGGGLFVGRLLILGVVISMCALGVVVGAGGRRLPEAAESKGIKESMRNSSAEMLDGSQRVDAAWRRYTAMLAVHPRADQVRHKLGRRFLNPGAEVSMISGKLSIGKEEHRIQVIRSQDGDEERVTIAMEGTPGSFSWSASEGGKSSGGSVPANLRSIIERVALDSADQFVLAQLRGASYSTMAEYVRPDEATDEYEGPVWDLVRVVEPVGALTAPSSPVRIYYINTVTGLIDRVESREGGEKLTAILSGWSEQNGERVATRTVWMRGKEEEMELRVEGVSYLAKR